VCILQIYNDQANYLTLEDLDNVDVGESGEEVHTSHALTVSELYGM
jgi:hypothetical protein